MINRAYAFMASVLVGLALTPPQVSVALAANPPLLVIVGLTFPAGNIQLADLKSAFRGRATYVEGQRLIPINHALASPMRVAFDRAILGLEPAAVGRFWIDRRLRDEGMPPKAVATPELALRVIAALPGAISYGRGVLLYPRVKVLTVDGMAAGEPGYALSPR